MDVLIFDESNNLNRLVRHYCGNNVQVIFCNDKAKLKEINFDEIDIAYVSSSEATDLLDIEYIYNNVNFLYIDTHCLKLKKNLKNFKKLNFFNINNDRFKILSQIFNHTLEFNN